MVYRLARPPSNLQLQSPLFGVLPGEIRNTIFEYALRQYEDDKEAYPKGSAWYRPGFTALLKSCSALLRTCELAYKEGQEVFFRDLEVAFWFDHGPPNRVGYRGFETFFGRFPPQVYQSLQKVRFFVTMNWLMYSQDLACILRQPVFRPSQLTITIRHPTLKLSRSAVQVRKLWPRYFIGNPELRVLQVEYETFSHWKEEMMLIIQDFKKIKLRVRKEDKRPCTEETEEREGHLSAEGTELKEWIWEHKNMGPYCGDLCLLGAPRLSGAPCPLGALPPLKYVVVRDTWKFVDTPLSDEETQGHAPSAA
ncbi:hypothetical protein GMOD_00009400 [Pyrenophora seminiperda CCB06]|uniref:Uncharacterized protein n=1 Tax=Pyrenophora seminiperda CCB06 TaxID=1302712 RepID=A0A3M7MGL9_9PLEO|nr:hypothetical protein GMOD_00009400 [Pyrenophora seminiperda CCB06]